MFQRIKSFNQKVENSLSLSTPKHFKFNQALLRLVQPSSYTVSLTKLFYVFEILYLHMDRTWMYGIQRTSAEYLQGLNNFIEVAEKNKKLRGEDMICCPCKDCMNLKKFRNSDKVRGDLIMRGFMQNYTCWLCHGEFFGETSTDIPMDDIQTEVNKNPNLSDDEFVEGGDRFDEMLHGIEEDDCSEHEKLNELYAESEKPLFPGCTNFSKLSAVLKLYNLKASNGWSDKSFTSLLKLLVDMLPNDNELPNSCYKAKKLMCPLGLEVQRIHACPNDCILYRNEHENMHTCPRCGVSRYKVKDGDEELCSTGRKRSASKVVWYFPIIPRFKRLFANPTDARYLRWHGEGRKVDDKLRHPADSAQWRIIDSKFPKFGAEIRNLRIGLSTDGINPFGNMSSRHSSWPVLLCIYNLPPWLCMKRKYIMMSLLISGPKQPGNDIDVYLAPLIDDLKNLWCHGVEVYDAYKNEYFNLKAMIFCTINDFPAYGNLSGYSVKGGKACPVCEDETVDMWLRNCKKTVYMGHRRFLPPNHPYRRNVKDFNGNIEMGRDRGFPLSGTQVHERVKGIETQFGKSSRDAPLKTVGYKKKSIFWDLPYWKDLQVRHCLDVMHIEKNVCDSLIGTLLNIQGKTKDSIKVRKDMVVEMGIRSQLAPEQRGTRTYLPPACYTLSKGEKTSLCKCLHGIKVPSGYSANMKKIVSLKDLKLLGMKSHDCHVLMTQMLPVAIRGILPDNVRHTVMKLCFFFNAINAKIVDPDTLDDLQAEVIETLCQLEMYFPPSFFDIMVHLIVHLVHEIKACGPVFLRYMYPFERYMGFLKGYVRNRNRPEGSIVEGYAAEEVIEFATSYMAGMRPIGVPTSRHEGRLLGVGTIGFKMITPNLDYYLKAHFCVLQHMTDIEPYIQEHMIIIQTKNPTRGQKWITKEHNKNFIEWIKHKVRGQLSTGETVDETVGWLAEGPKFNMVTYQAYDINGFTFYTTNQASKSTNENNGVTLVASSQEFSRSKDAKAVQAKNAYYGKIEEIWEVDYFKFKIPLFRCIWVDNRRGVRVDDATGFTIVNFAKLGYHDEPFILAKQANQVFYIEDPAKNNCHIVLHGKRRILGVENVVDEEEWNQFDDIPPFSVGIASLPTHDDIDEAVYMRVDHEEGLLI